MTARRLGLIALCFALVAPVSLTYADSWSLDFDTLPSAQGWRYEGIILAESDVYSVDGASLLQSTVGSGGETLPHYSLGGVVDFDKPMILEFTARVLAHENLGSGTPPYGRGFNVQIVGDNHEFWIGLDNGGVTVNGFDIAFNTTRRHHYRLEIYSPGTAQLYIDDYPRQGARSDTPQIAGNRITFGDTTSHENTDVEISALTFTVQDDALSDILVEKTVDNTYPATGQPVQFTILASNIGVDDATDVVVVDRLPEGLEIPTGLAASVDVGTYDPVSGQWTIGDLATGVTRSLVIPAVVSGANPPDCIVNTADSLVVDIPGDNNDSASAVVHQNSGERCVDLGVDFSISSGPLSHNCDQTGTYLGEVEVTNYGPVPARNVSVALSVMPTIAPNVRFEDSDCTNAPSAVCEVGEIAPGETVTISVTSDPYQSYNTFSQEVSVSASTTDIDYDLFNNNPAVTGTGGDFSSCSGIDIEVPPLGTFPLGPGCFIATAAYGTPMDERLDTLRDFRDQHLLTNAPGRAIVDFYYRHSPSLADFIAERDWLRAIVRGALAPLIFALDHPFLAAGAVIWAIVIVVLAAREGRRRKRRPEPVA